MSIEAHRWSKHSILKDSTCNRSKDEELYDDLKTCLPQQALLGLFSIGGSVVEMITDALFLDRTKATPQQMGLTCVNYDYYGIRGQRWVVRVARQCRGLKR